MDSPYAMLDQRARRDIGILLANIDYMRKEIDLDPEDIALIEQIRNTWGPTS